MCEFFDVLQRSDAVMILSSTPAHKLAALNSHFPTFHHPGQLPPDTDWRTWLIMAGRGFGKTRAGAEWVMSLVRGEAGTYPFVSSGDETPIRCTRSHGISSSLDANG